MQRHPSTKALGMALLLALAGCGDGEQPPGVSIALEAPRPRTSLTLPAVAGASDPNRPLVVIDPGHGGHDPGAVSPFGGRREKDVTLAIGKAIHDALAERGRVRVALTRSDDRSIAHEDRYEIARRLGASLFISVHADAAQRQGASGATIYTLSEVASDREAALLAARENDSGLSGAPVLSDNEGVNRILIDLAQRESMERSADFAQLLHREASPIFTFQDNWHRFAALAVLKAPDMPSILFETGYLTNPGDVAFIHSPEGQQKIALGVRQAVEAHFARRNAALASR